MEHVETDELKERIKFIVGELENNFKTISPVIKKIGDLRQEAQLIYKELVRRGELRKDDSIEGKV